VVSCQLPRTTDNGQLTKTQKKKPAFKPVAQAGVELNGKALSAT
jgi:hypothetical protein